jgi:hypothetical protein
MTAALEFNTNRLSDEQIRILEIEKQIERMEAQWTDKQIQADQVFVNNNNNNLSFCMQP